MYESCTVAHYPTRNVGSWLSGFHEHAAAMVG